MTRLASLAILLLFSLTAYPQETVLDEMDSSVNWSIYKAEGVGIDTSTVAGQFGKCLKIDFDFVTGGGYGGVAARFPIEYGDNYRFTFWVKGNAPDNNFEFKITDDEAENVWWVNRQNFHFPEEWQQITVRKRHLDFAWGPTEDRTLHKSGRLEFIIASSNGGKG
ncbi:MAG TPA: carbohydrate binding domain-containing protein, partial [Calditrichia bacterium]|nr:carbohydrate binding domain-containing protein [Calditrichia bacterium]